MTVILCAASLAAHGADDADDPHVADAWRKQPVVVERRGMPVRVHVFEDFETEIEKRWWLRGQPVTEADLLPPSRSGSLPNTRAMRSAETKDFDRKMGDQSKTYRAVVFNPVPGPPMGPNTRLAFRFRLSGTDTLRVQIYSLSNGYHRRIILTGLPRDVWTDATVDMTQLRRPDGSGGPLAKDERIDDIQFYVDPLLPDAAPDCDVLIDDIMLYEAAPPGDTRPFPRRVIFTGWFDTGKQGTGHEWPGDFDIVENVSPLMWDVARSVKHVEHGLPWINLHMRGRRPLSGDTRLRFAYHLDRPVKHLLITLHDRDTGRAIHRAFANVEIGKWATLDVDLSPRDDEPRHAHDIRVTCEGGATLMIDDVLLYEPGDTQDD